MTWLYRWLVDLFNAIAAIYYRRKYGAAARQLGRSPHEAEDERRAFIIIEIDGLAYDYLRKAVRAGFMPYLSRLILNRDLGLTRWRCGLPSTTPASQAGILYGNNWDIPGFRWYEKETGESIMCKLPGVVRTVQERIAAGRAGLLRGGSSYTNMFDGDARLSLFTLSALGRHRLFENVRGLGFLILFGLSPLRLIRVVGLSLRAWLVYVVKRFVAWVRSGPRKSKFTFWGPLLEIFNNIIFREVTTFSVMIDIYRGMPAIYAAYTGYDEIAHHFGADSREALGALRGIDKQIRQIDRIRQLYTQKQYDLYILSDHGMTNSLPFLWAYGQTLDEFLAEHTGQEVESSDGLDDSEGLPEARFQFLLDELRGLEERSHRPLPAQLLRVTRERLEARMLAEALDGDWDLSQRGNISVRNSGSLSHIYFDVAARPMDLSEVALIYPGLLDALLSHDGIGLVVGRDGEDVVLASRKGTLRIGPTEQRLEGQDPLGDLSHPAWAAAQVARVARFPHAGDLILLGAWDGKRVICFEEQVASHGGLGGPQGWPFLAYPPGDGFGARAIENSEDVYTRLVRVYGSYE
ncbi:MAG: alkaline phosphatase family protein [Anaerolineae bacterium]